MDINQLTVTGKVMQLTNTGNSNGTKMALGTIGVYRGKNKETNQPEFDNLPFVAYGAVSEYIKQDTKMMLSGKINTYTKQDGSQYGQRVVQMQVLVAYPIATPDKPAYTEHPSTGLDMGSIDEAVDQITIKGSDLPF
ncbi:hypothetical protein [Lactiplantibacillus plantarum]|uniref:hypothetical protein n=1 Tax=Lactiplantibacillus plantarum TaxID=1590 RepID=UPI002EDB226F|nr:hypothetical protein [Lactiplantibacillus plantarum]MCG0816999.1 hypothetical protein [Lactiplantibacillus plantarum]MCG0842074.1 hypothetical protein [Lactiplantibacillus plantarum]MCG0939167.1 hypothetical protein [Lactiplantibacillus plantarum]MCG0948758.1 hypothetical protein [Lactiplantibacillus plantarum]